MAAPPFIPLTWRNVTGPSNAAALDMMRKSGQDLGGAIEGLGTNVDQFADEKQKRETDAFIAELGALPDDAARQDALKQAETGWMNLDRINTATTDLQAQDYTTAASARAQILGDIDVTTAERKEESRLGVDEILTSGLPPEDISRLSQEHKAKGLADTGGRLKAYANEQVQRTPSGITPESISALGLDPSNPKSYTRATYNTLINDEYLRLKESNPYADDSVLRKGAKDAVSRTEAGTFFEQQKWYEELERPGVAAEEERIRKKDVVQTWRTSNKDITTSYSALSANPTDENRNQFRSDLRELSRQYAEDPTSLGPMAETRLKTWTTRAIRDYTQNSFDPEEAYLKQFGGRTEVVNGEVQIMPLGINDFTPEKVNTFIENEIKNLTEELPYADPAEIVKHVGTKIQKSGLAVRFAQGALPAQLKAIAEKYRYDDEVTRVKRRSDVLTGIETNDNGLTGYVYDTLFERFQKEGQSLKPAEAGKLRKELAKTINLFKGYIPNWDTLHKDTRKTYTIAMAEVLSGASIDEDSNFLWLDPNDYPVVAHGSSTGDMSGISKNAALTALLGHINPYGGSGSKNARSNRQIIDDLQGTITETNTKKATSILTKKAAKTGVSPNTKDFLGIDKAVSDALISLDTHLKAFQERYRKDLAQRSPAPNSGQ